MGQTIGSSARYSTWGVLRSPMWKGSGYRDEVLPANKNTGKAPYSGTPVGFSMVYPESLAKLSFAFPFVGSGIEVGFDTYWANSMCLGLNYYTEQFGNDELDIPTIISVYLTHGQGIWTLYSIDGTFTERVLNGYTYAPYLSSGLTGYDTPRTRDQYRGAVANVTFTPGPTLSPITTDVTIDDTLFPDNLAWDIFAPNRGIYIGTYTWPVPAGGLTWDQPWWTVNSLTMP